MNLRELKKLKIAELAAMAREMEIENSAGLRKQELILALLNEKTKNNEDIFGERALGGGCLGACGPSVVTLLLLVELPLDKLPRHA